MMDPLRKVTPGEPLRIRAPTWNALMDTARAVRQMQQSGDSRLTFTRDPDIILVRNATEELRDIWHVLGLEEATITPAENEENFEGGPVALDGVVPTGSHAGRFAILLEPVAPGYIGRALVSGVCQAKVDMQAEGDQWADVADGDASALRSGSAGGAQILWVESGTGVKWAYVRLGPAVPRFGKAELIGDLYEGMGPADAWLLEWDGLGWARTATQISVHGDQGFRGVAFGRTEAVDQGDRIDVWYSGESQTWQGVVGGFYFHAITQSAGEEGDLINITLDVGEGDDTRVISVAAYTPYSPVKDGDQVSITWNSFSRHFDIGKFIAPLELGCHLETVDDLEDPEHGKTRVNVDTLPGHGLEVDDSGECKRLTVKPGCHIAKDANGLHVILTNMMTAPLYVTSDTPCPKIALAPGYVEADCGISVVTASDGMKVTIGVNRSQLLGPGLKAYGTCGFTLDTGCGLDIVDGKVIADVPAITGSGLWVDESGDCKKLQWKGTCHFVQVEEGHMLNVGSLAGTSLTTEAGGVQGCERLAFDTAEDDSEIVTVVTATTLRSEGCTVFLDATTRDIEFHKNAAGVLIGVSISAEGTTTSQATPCGCASDCPTTTTTTTAEPTTTTTTTAEPTECEACEHGCTRWVWDGGTWAPSWSTCESGYESVYPTGPGSEIGEVTYTCCVATTTTTSTTAAPTTTTTTTAAPTTTTTTTTAAPTTTTAAPTTTTTTTAEPGTTTTTTTADPNGCAGCGNLSLTVSGTSNGTCGTCAGYDGTYTLTKASGECVWDRAPEPRCGGPKSILVQWHAGNARYELYFFGATYIPSSGFSCTASMTWSLAGGPDDCMFPPTVTTAPV